MSGPSGTVTPDSRSAWRREFLLQLAICALALTAINAVRPMVTYRALDLGADPLQIGIVASAFSILPVLTAVAIGRWVDRIGEARFILAGLALIATGCLATALAPNLLILGLAQIVTGTGHILNLVAGQAMVANRGPRTEREHRFGWYATVSSLGQLLGPLVAAGLAGGAMAATAGASATGEAASIVFLSAMAAAIVGTILALFLQGSPRAQGSETQTAEPQMAFAKAIGQVLRRSGMPAAMLVSITVISSIDVLIAYLPLFGEEHGLSVEIIGILLAIRAGASLISRVFMMKMINLLGRGRLLTVSMLAAGGSILVMTFSGGAPMLFLAALMVLTGFGLGLGQPMTIAWVANRSPRAERATALGVRLTGNRAALIVVPTLMGAIAGTAGVMAIFIVLAGFLIGGAGVAARAPLSDDAIRGP